MARRGGSTEVQFNRVFFDRILKSAGVSNLTKRAADQALSVAKSTAPVDTGDYRRGLKVERHDSRYRTVWRVVGTDWKTLILESKTGNLARALRTVRKG